MLVEEISLNLLFNFNDLQDNEELGFSGKWLEFLNTCDLPENFLQSDCEYSTNDLVKSVAFLGLFVQENFTGPFSNADSFLSSDLNAVERLKVNGEELNANVKHPEYLLASKIIIQDILTKSNSIVAHWWYIRTINVHQLVLEDKAQHLYEEFKKSVEFLLQHSPSITNKEYKGLLLIEIANGYLLFHRTAKCDELLQNACECLEVELKVEGILGIRTKFQQKALPQLCLKVIQKKEYLPSALATNGSTCLPKLLNHEDDTRLEKIKFVNEEDNLVINISSLLQTLVFSKLKQVSRSQPKDRLSDEELEPYINTLLQQDHGPLPLRIATLLFNIKQEATHKRTVERSLKQCEDVLKHIADGRYTAAERFSYLFAATLAPIWEVKKQLGNLLLSLGLVKTALDLYIDIQAWDEVIESYNHLELRHKAADIIRQELEKKPTVKLYCLLGDATDDVSCYETAWDFSNQTSSQAQRHWGNHYFAKKDYDRAIPHLQRSVEINPLQEVQWLRLGYAAISLENWELASHAYLTYTHLEPNGFESWNNLATALIRMGDKNRAHKILGESLKCNFNNWKVWENYMNVSVDTLNFEDVLNAYNKLIELKERFIDLEVLQIVIPALAMDQPDAKGRSTRRLWKKASELLAHQSIQHGSEWILWDLASLVALTPLSKAQKLQKAFSTFVQNDTNWPQLEETSLKAINICSDLCELSIAAVENHDPAEGSAVTSQLSSARLSAQACVRAVENNFDKWDSTSAKIGELKQLLEKTTEELRKRI